MSKEKTPRYWIGRGGEDDPDAVFIADREEHEIILRGGKMALPKIQEMVRRANGENPAKAESPPAPPTCNWCDAPLVPGSGVLIKDDIYLCGRCYYARR